VTRTMGSGAAAGRPDLAMRISGRRAAAGAGGPAGPPGRLAEDDPAARRAATGTESARFVTIRPRRRSQPRCQPARGAGPDSHSAAVRVGAAALQ
jgi:hypothetical protein